MHRHRLKRLAYWLKIQAGFSLTETQATEIANWEQQRRIHDTPFVWQAMRVGGGGIFETPELKRAAAIDYVLQKGTHQLCTVDDVCKIIFYRSA